MHAHAIANNRAPAHKANSGDQTLQHTRVRRVAIGSAQIAEDQQIATTGQRHNRKRANANGVEFLLAPPSGRQREQPGDGEFQGGHSQQVPV